MTTLNFKTKSNLVPSTVTAKTLRASAVYGVPQEIYEGVSMILADNAKDYTGPGTNTYIVGDENVWIIDPGPDDGEHVDAVLDAVKDSNVLGILVTHSHLDHSPAAGAIREATGAPVYGFGGLDTALAVATDEDIDLAFDPDQTLSGGETLGDGRFACQVLHTPGHFPNHLCYFFPELGILFSGDHVMGWSTTVIVPPLGNLADYLTSLDLMERTGAVSLFPSHGNPVEDAARRIQEIRDHRRMRHEQVAACVERGLTDHGSIVQELYEGLTPRLLQAAEGCVAAHMELLNSSQGADHLFMKKLFRPVSKKAG